MEMKEGREGRMLRKDREAQSCSGCARIQSPTSDERSLHSRGDSCVD